MMSENRSSENDLGGPGRWHGFWGDVFWRGLRSRQWQEGALKSTPGQIGKGLHPAHGTQRRRPGFRGPARKELGSWLPCSVYPVLKCFSFWRETGGGREEGPRAQAGVPVFGNTERHIRLMATNER